MSTFVPVAHVADVPPGQGRTVHVGERPIALFNADGVIHAFEGACLHRGGPVGDGEIEDGIVTCPWHGYQYHVATGRYVLDERAGLARYEVRVEGEQILVALPAG